MYLFAVDLFSLADAYACYRRWGFVCSADSSSLRDRISAKPITRTEFERTEEILRERERKGSGENVVCLCSCNSGIGYGKGEV
jgi:hypothetical protein